MSDEELYETFMRKVLNRPLPDTPARRVHILAKELAEGIYAGVWESAQIVIKPSERLDSKKGRVPVYIPDREFQDYFSRRWNDNYPSLNLLRLKGYADEKFKLTQTALDLVDESETADIFISYSHQESSSFALLILRSLNEIGLYPFPDMAIPEGDDWDERIKSEIEKRDTFIVILGNETLESSYIRDEITWAFGWDKVVIPVWHNGFTDKSDPHGLDPDLFKRLNGKQAIVVSEPPSAASYHEAIIKLLNRFGVTP